MWFKWHWLLLDVHGILDCNELKSVLFRSLVVE